MTDNLDEQEIRRRLIIFLRISAEVWTDVLKLLPRRTLVQKISPACYRLKEICNVNVKSVHVITRSNHLTNKLKWDDPKIHGQIEQLTGSKCKLANHFRLTNLRICEKNKIILPHCLDLLKGCQISTEFNKAKSEYTGATFFDCLTILEPTKPITIKIIQSNDPAKKYWSNPTVRNCNRIAILTSYSFRQVKVDMMAMAMDIVDWLHYKPELDSDDDDDASAADQVRCLIFSYFRSNHAMDWLLNHCIQNLQNSKDPADRRQYVFNFDMWIQAHWTWPPTLSQGRFVENHATGEVLVLELVPEGPTDAYRLRRCLAQEVAGGKEFYAKVFKRDRVYGKQQFNIDDKEAEGTEVFIE